VSLGPAGNSKGPGRDSSMTSVWQSAAVMVMAAAALASSSVAILLARRSRADWRALGRRVDELSLRLRGGPGLAETPALRIDRPPSSASPTLIAVPSMVAPGSESMAAEAADALSHRYGPIWALAEAGDTPAAIAQTMGQPVGRVELILALRRQADALGEAVLHG
jgi:hypothetical protein